MPLTFTKLHGCGNDYLFVDCTRGSKLPGSAEIPAIARYVSNRRTGVGSDGVILICPDRLVDFRMEMYNADGSRGEMCGNGIRCVAKYAFDHGIVSKNEISAETGAGILTLQLFTGADGKVDRVRVNMGKPRLTKAEIPMLGEPSGDQTVNQPLNIMHTVFHITTVSMGNPHCVIFIDDVDNYQVEKYGPLIENHDIFPRRTNVEFVQVISPTEVRQRTWERGAGETLACGTGASAVCVAGVLNGLTDSKILNHLSGGDLELEWAADGNLYMTGPAAEVFSGEITL
jgi:diaminopimelate epimerase